jgi:Asp-tRNA(Asn)/Glu-tRNA(Gln) amidotransferase A subunit family amidase
MSELCELSALALQTMLRRGDCSATEIIQACCDRIEALEPDVKGFVHIDRAAAMMQARALDASEHRGLLCGIPVAIKDTIDVSGFVCSWGSPAHANRIPSRDAYVVQRLREAGAVIIGTTTSTEYAIARAPATRNPYDLNRTPGGSSSGSAAAVAANMVPLAVGTQTLGSIVRPSTYCGIYGYKPSVGTIAMDGVMPLSPHFDTVGPMARCLDDIHLFNRALSIASAIGDHLSPAAATPVWLIQGPYEDRIEPETAAALQEAAAALRAAGHSVTTHDLPARFQSLTECFETIVFHDIAIAHGHGRDTYGDLMSDRFREIVNRGRAVSEGQYHAALAESRFYRQYLDTVLGEHGIVLAPATDGVAPPYSERTGDQKIQSLWSVVGYPALAVPCPPVNGLPIGVQLATRRNHDAAILAAARALEADTVRGDTSRVEARP